MANNILWRSFPKRGPSLVHSNPRCMFLLFHRMYNPNNSLTVSTESNNIKLVSRLSTEPSSPVTNTMPFEEYRKLRKNLKMRSRISGLPLAIVGMSLSSLICVQLNPRMFEMTQEEIQPIFGLDPLVFSGMCGAASAVLGYMLGGTLFNYTWRLFAREKSKQFFEKDDEFLKRLHKHRFSAVSKYDDDYYGDKVLTLSDYRQWVRQQQKRKKAMEQLNKNDSMNNPQK